MGLIWLAAQQCVLTEPAQAMVRRVTARAMHASPSSARFVEESGVGVPGVVTSCSSLIAKSVTELTAENEIREMLGLELRIPTNTAESSPALEL